MLQTLIKKTRICFALVLFTVTCVSCKTDSNYYTSDYLNDLADNIGIYSENDDSFSDLCKWQVVEEKDRDLLDKELNYDFLIKSINNLLSEELNINDLKQSGWIDNRVKETDTVSKENAEDIIHKVVEQINNKEYETAYDYEYRSPLKSKNDLLKSGDLFFDEEDASYKIVTEVVGNDYHYRDATFEEIFSKLEIADSFEVDFSKAELIPYNQEDNNSSYINNKYQLLSAKSHSFNVDGYKITYNLSSSGVDVHLTKSIGQTKFKADLSIYNVKPSISWLYKENDLKNCFFNIKMNTTEKIDVSYGKYANYYLQFKDLDSSSFLSKIKSSINPLKDNIETSIPICQIKVPIEGIPTAYLNLDLLINFSAEGNISLVLYNSHLMGFETKNGQIRFINEHDNDFDSSLSAGGKAGLTANLGIMVANSKLLDLQIDGGLKAQVKSTLYLYDDEGNLTSDESAIAYSTLQQISKENSNVKVCGDVSLHWLLDLIFNTSNTMMYKLGFNKTFNILDEDAQVFGNKHHIENGHFVEQCTRKKNNKIKQANSISSEKIVLDSYAEVIKINETYQIKILSLPKDCQESEIKYTSLDNSIASVENGLVQGLKAGSVKIRVHSNDERFDSYVNILVSSEL